LKIEEKTKTKANNPTEINTHIQDYHSTSRDNRILSTDHKRLYEIIKTGRELEKKSSRVGKLQALSRRNSPKQYKSI